MTSPHLVKDSLVRLTVPSVMEGLRSQWELMLGSAPPQLVLELKTAHIAYETGLKWCHCHNLGNIKHVDGDGHNWTMFACGEEVELLSDGSLPAYWRSPQVVTHGAPYKRANGKTYQSVTVAPPHPASRFVAFDSLADGVKGQLSYLKRHPAVLAALVSGDVASYNHQLKLAGYYTGSEPVYLAGLKAKLVVVRQNKVGPPN